MATAGPSATSDAEDRDDQHEFERFKLEAKSFGRILFVSGLLGAAAIASIPFTVWYLYSKNVGYTDVVFPFILVAGVVALVLVLAVLVGLFKRMGLTDSRFALGLPNGSISAIIALMLILVFAMLSVLVQVNVGYEVRRVTVTLSQADQIPGAEILSRNCGSILCDIDRRVEKSPAAIDIGKQLVTTVSTLVVAISAFYFGSAQTATAAQRLVQAGKDADSGVKKPESDQPEEKGDKTA